MIAYFFEALPFLFSIAVKVGDTLFSDAIASLIVRGIPYRLSTDQHVDVEKKYTIADLASDANLRFTYGLTLCFSIVSAASVTAKSSGTTAGLLTICGLAMLGGFSIPFFTKPLGWFNVARKKGGMRRSTKAVIVLALVDVALMAITLATVKPEQRPTTPATQTHSSATRG